MAHHWLGIKKILEGFLIENLSNILQISMIYFRASNLEEYRFFKKYLSQDFSFFQSS